MNSPLAPHLTRFSTFAREIPPVLATMPAAPLVTFTEPDLSARLEAERARAKAEAAAETASQLAQMKAEYDRLTSEKLAGARTEWAATVGDKLGAELVDGLAALKVFVCEHVVAVLAPLLAQAVVARTTSHLLEALDQLIADPARPPITVCGPIDLLAAIQSARPLANVTYQTSDESEVTISADGARVRTRLVAALAAFTPEAP